MITRKTKIINWVIFLLLVLFALIYLVPVITVAASVLILREPFTWMTGAGTVLTLIGLLLSEGKLHWKEGTHHETGTGQMRPGD